MTDEERELINQVSPELRIEIFRSLRRSDKRRRKLRKLYLELGLTVMGIVTTIWLFGWVNRASDNMDYQSSLVDIKACKNVNTVDCKRKRAYYEVYFSSHKPAPVAHTKDAW